MGTASNTTVTVDTYVIDALDNFWCSDWHSRGSPLDNKAVLPSWILVTSWAPLHILSSHESSVTDSGDFNDNPNVFETEWALCCAFLIAAAKAWCLWWRKTISITVFSGYILININKKQAYTFSMHRSPLYYRNHYISHKISTNVIDTLMGKSSL